MLGKILKPGWQSDSPERRIAAIKKLDPNNEQDLAVLDNLAMQDSDQNVRTAAINAIAKPEHIFDLLQQGKNEKQQSNIEQGFINLIGNQSSLTADHYQSLMQARADCKPYLLQHCPIPELREQLIDDFDQQQLASLVADIDYAQTRIQVASTLESENALEAARKHLKGKDKNALKIVKAKLDAIREVQRVQDAANAQAQEICTKLSYLAEHDDWRKEFTPQFKLSLERWSAIKPTPKDQLVADYTELTEKINKRLKEIEDAQALEQETQACLTSFELNLKNACTSSLTQLLENQQADSQAIEELNKRWLNVTSKRMPSSQQSQQHQDLNSALNIRLNLGEKLLNALTNKASKENQSKSAGSNHLPILEQAPLEQALDLISKHKRFNKSAAKEELAELLSVTTQQHQAAEEQYQQGLKKLHHRVNRLIANTEKGNLRVAQKEMAATQKLAESYKGKDKKSLDERLVKAAESVEKLSDWHRFATEPKFIALCESMEALTPEKLKEKLHPDNIAQKIRKLQNQWKNLGILHDETLWDRFKLASDAAFAPCSAFFNERDQTRNANLSKREPIIAILIKLLENTAWSEDTDYQAVESKLKKAHQQWQKIKDVPQEQGKQQWQRYKSARENLFEKLSVEYDRNHDAQKQLIEQSDKLVSMGIDQNSFEKLKHLQSLWKEIGITRTKEDRKAWREFKKSTDTAYEAIKLHQREKDSQHNDMLSEHLRIIKELNQLAKLNEASDPKVEALSNEFHGLERLPKDFPEQKLFHIEKSFKQAVSKYQKSRQRQVQQAKKQQATLIKHKANLCSELEKSYKTEPLDQSLIDDLLAQFENGEILDKTTNKRLIKRMEAAALQDRSDFDQQRQKLCIQLEIANNLDSPKQDRALRTQMQLETMSNKGLGSNAQLESIQQLKLDWLCLPGATPSLQASMENRLSSIFKK